MFYTEPAKVGGGSVNLKTNDALWVRCPICNGKTRIKVHRETVLVCFPLYCPKCKKETNIDVVQLKMVSSK